MGATSGHGPRVAAVLVAAAAVAVATLAGCTGGGGGDDIFTSKAVVSSESKTCLDCHTKKQPSIVTQWQASPHAAEGVGCYECHQADPSDPDVMDHFGYSVAVLVTPYLALGNRYLSLGIMFVCALAIIALFNYYYSVVKDESFRVRFAEMALLSGGVSLVSFLIGLALRRYTGIDM